MLALRRFTPFAPPLPRLASLPALDRCFAPELHRASLRATMTLVDGDPESKKTSNTGDKKQKRES